MKKEKPESLARTIAKSAVSAVFAALMTGIFALLTLFVLGYTELRGVPSPLNGFAALSFYTLPTVLVGVVAFQTWRGALGRGDQGPPLPRALRLAFAAFSLFGLGMALTRFAMDGAAAAAYPLLWAVVTLIALSAALADNEAEDDREPATEAEAAREVLAEAPTLQRRRPRRVRLQ